MYKRLAIVFAFMFVTLANVKAFEIPEIKGRVSDYANVLTQNQITQMNDVLSRIEKEHPDKPQIVFLLPNSLPEEGIEQYANDVFRSWHIGQKAMDNGVLVVIAPNDRKMRIEVGYGLEANIPDSTAAGIIDKMKPKLRAKKYQEAMMVATEGIVSHLPHKSEAVTNMVSHKDPHPMLTLLIFMLFGGGVLYVVYRMFFKEVDEYKPYSGTKISNPKYGSGYDTTSIGGFKKNTSRPSASPTAKPKRSSSYNDGFATGLGTGLGLGSSSRSDDSSSSSWGSSSDSSSSSGWGSSSSDSGFSGGGGDSGGGGASGDW